MYIIYYSKIILFLTVFLIVEQVTTKYTLGKSLFLHEISKIKLCQLFFLNCA